MSALYLPPNRRLNRDLSFVADAVPEGHGELPTYAVGIIRTRRIVGGRCRDSGWVLDGRDWMVLAPEAPAIEAGSALTAPDGCLYQANTVDAPWAVALFGDTFRASGDNPALGSHRPMVFSVWGAMARVRGARGVFSRRGPGANKWDINGVGAARARKTFLGSLFSPPCPRRGLPGFAVRNLTVEVKVAARRSAPCREAGAPGLMCRDTDEVKSSRAGARQGGEGGPGE